MKLMEAEGREILARHGIPVPAGRVVSAPGELDGIAGPVVVKALVPVGGRGKAGGVKFAGTLEEARARVGEIIGLEIKGCRVRSVLVSEKVDIARELYLSISVDRDAGMALLMASALGGMDIESVPEEKIYRRYINPLIGLQSYQLRDLAGHLALEKPVGQQVSDIARKLYSAFVAEDAELLEINPLAVMPGGKVVAADAKAVIDDDSLFRHPGHREVEPDITPLEQEARERGISFVQLDGNIGVIANGAGLTMATLDALGLVGGNGGTFLDLGGTDDPEKVKQAFRILKKARPKVILMNIFGGITRCDTVATGVHEVVRSEGAGAPVVARIKGWYEERAREILKDAGLITATTMEEAARKAAELSREA
ncbi:MAG: ADP-forming succinate--CoA ligase subunit beta [Euryarchaeota archaeon]|nr:ADP-forming succinate--CoA ligase subunit beta [Euryarchaeota archaeon]